MKRIGITGHQQFPLDEWRKQTINLSELFEIPKDLSSEEIGFARRIMDTCQLEKNDDEGLIKLISKPSNFMSFLVNIKRILEQYNKQSSLK